VERLLDVEICGFLSVVPDDISTNSEIGGKFPETGVAPPALFTPRQIGQ